MALFLDLAQSRGDVVMCCGFESQGAVQLAGLTTSSSGDLNCSGGRFINRNNLAIFADEANIAGSVLFAPQALGSSPFVGSGSFFVDGSVSMYGTHIGHFFAVQNARFAGSPTDQHGITAPGLSVGDSLIWQNVTMDKGATLDLRAASLRNSLIWQNVTMDKGATLDLRAASLRTFLISKNSWPEPGKLLIDQLTYSLLGAAPGEPPWDVHDYLSFLRLQPSGFYPQPYREMATMLRENGLEQDAIRVQVAAEDARYRRYGMAGRLVGGFLKWTMGYGHRPLLTIGWMLGVIAMGWMMVTIGKRAGVMRPTWPESIPSVEEVKHERLHPLLYSFDVFLPFVNLHQEHYWWPDADRTSECIVLGRKLRVSGSLLRYYLWAQIAAGWLLSAIFIAGVTGLIRND
jgi:hypothetical protein